MTDMLLKLSGLALVLVGLIGLFIDRNWGGMLMILGGLCVLVSK